MTSLATACFLVVVLGMIDAHDRHTTDVKTARDLRIGWWETVMAWALSCLGAVLLIMAWGPERAVAMLLLLLTIAGATAILIRRVFHRHQHAISAILVGCLLVLACLEWVALEV